MEEKKEEKNEYPKLFRITGWICEACLNGEGEQCHTPGCFLIRHRAPDFPICRDVLEICEPNLADTRND